MTDCFEKMSTLKTLEKSDLTDDEVEAGTLGLLSVRTFFLGFNSDSEVSLFIKYSIIKNC